jgi:hypothetical protein
MTSFGRARNATLDTPSQCRDREKHLGDSSRETFEDKVVLKQGLRLDLNMWS